MSFNVKELNKKYDFVIYGPSSILEPKNNTILFCKKEYYDNYKKELEKLKSCLIILDSKTIYDEKLCEENYVIQTDNPRYLYGRILEVFFLNPKIKEQTKISKKATIYSKEGIGQNVTIEDYVVIEKNVKIQDNTIIKSGCKILEGTQIGKNCFVANNSVLGTDGLAFEYEKTKNEYQKIPQMGNLIIEDNVSIGSNCSIAKGAILNTIIKEGSKIDNNCFISHNAKLGKNVIVVGNTIIMGSAIIGYNTYISGNVTIRDNINIGSDVLIGMGSVVTEDISSNEVVMGVPAKSQVRKKK